MRKDRKETWKQWMEKKGIHKWFQRDNLIILILSGVLLFIIALPTKDGEESGLFDSQTQSGGENTLTQEERAENEASLGQESLEEAQNTREDYCAYLEKRLEETLSGVSGVGKVKVMITLKSSEELVVEKDTPVSRSSTNEEDSQGGSRILNQMESSESTVYKTQDGDSEPYVVKTLLPEVEGVVVVAQGAGTGTIDKSVTEIVQALFDIEAHKVKVVKMESDR